MSSDITLILLNYNNHSYLKSCLESVFRHGSHFSKVIFVDDRSDDVPLSTYCDLIKSFRELEITCIFNESNVGVTKSLLKSLDVVTTRYVQVLATDDMFGEDNMPFQSDIDEKNVYISRGKYVDQDGNFLKEYNNLGLDCILFRSIIYYSNPIKAPGFIASKKIIRESLKNTKAKFEDWPILRYAVSMGGEIKTNQSSQVLYRQHDQSLSSKSDSAKKSWMIEQVLLFLRESKSYKTFGYTRLMIEIQIKWLTTRTKIGKLLYSFIRYLDIRRIIYFLVRLLR